VWSIGVTEFGSFVDGVPAPLGIGTVEARRRFLAARLHLRGLGVGGRRGISRRFGGWRAYLRDRLTWFRPGRRSRSPAATPVSTRAAYDSTSSGSAPIWPSM